MKANPRARILVACIGNIFLGDDGFGVEVAQRLSLRRLPDEVTVVDFGIRGLDLAYALLDGYEIVILVDAAPRGQAPGTLYVVEPNRDEILPNAGDNLVTEAHNLSPAKVLRLAAVMGGATARILLVGCEPESIESESDMRMGLSPAVLRAVDQAIPLIESTIAELHESPDLGRTGVGEIATKLGRNGNV